MNRDELAKVPGLHEAIPISDAIKRADFPGICRRWLSASDGDLTDDEAVCFTALIHVVGGMHHLSSVRRYGHYVTCIIHGSSSTFDYDRLTKIVLVAHQFCVRFDLSNGGPRALKLSAFPLARRHPSLADLQQRIAAMAKMEIVV